jgi:hypothetical protein
MATREQRLDTLKRLTLDDKLAAFLEQELQAVEAENYRVEYVDLRARRFLPLNSSVPAGAETFAFRVWDVFGEAVWAANYANGIPNTAVRGEKIVGKVESILAGYSYSTQDLRAAAMASVPLETELANAAMEAIERKVDKTAALGDAARGFIGFANHPNPTLLAATGAWSNPATTNDQVFADLMRLAKRMRSDTSEIHSPNSLLLPTDAFDSLATRLLNTANSAGDTILSAFIKTNPWIKSVESWPRLNQAGVGGVGRAIAYKKDKNVVDLVIPMEPLQHAPQQVALNYHVPVESRFGGVRVRQPKAIVYMDGVS